ncbi:MAG TPA: DNA polymerase I [Candidatus Onthoplasma faecipullorum]|nr:DNA polymerase I [Candidatus Onthoplasma faecipullorum]
MEKFVIIDGNSLINRAFYGLPPLKSLSGKQCGAVYGFVNMMISVITQEKPKYLVCVFDAGKHTFRHDMYAEYKGTREGMPEDLHEQLLTLKELLKAMGIEILEIPEIEADDIIGSLTRKFNEEFMLISGDKDLLQLIDDHVTVWLTQKGISSVLKVDRKVLKEEFNIEPYQVIELKAIMGDASDNIPGVSGIGKVGAHKLIEEYGNLDNVYKNLENIKGSTRTKLENDKDMAYLSKKLATIKLDVPLDVKIEDCEYTLPFSEEAVEIMTELGFKSILNRKEYFTKPVERAPEINIHADIVEIDSMDEFNTMLNELGDSFAVNNENMSLNFACNNKEYVLYTSGEIFTKNLDKLKEIFSSTKQKICFDAKNLMHYLSDFGIELNNYLDISIAIYIANEMDAEIKLDDALELNNIITEAKTLALYKLKEIYINKLINNFQLKLYSDIELPLVKVLYDMEKTGIKIDVQAIKTLSASYHEELSEVEKNIYALAGEEFNINSPKQLQSILFDKLKIEYNKKKSTSIEVLNEIMNKHEIVPQIMRYRKIAKLISTYLDGMLNYVSEDGKIHTTYMQRTTSTGRLSSREPNLQNLPIRDDEGRALRKMFMSEHVDGCIVSADYNQIELRLIANFSGDENMIADYLSGKDIHTSTASKIFNVPLDKVAPNMRRVAKSVNFGIIYGISAYGLSQNINSTPKEAGEFIKKYMEIYPKVKIYGEECIEKARELGYATTLMGRVRHIPDINSKNHVVRGFAERIAKNMPLQGSASDIIKIAMIKVFNRFNKENLKSKLILQIHDELVVDCVNGEEKTVEKILKEEMESVVNLKVPLIVNVSSGKTLYDAK